MNDTHRLTIEQIPAIDMMIQPAEVVDPLSLDLDDQEVVDTVKDNIRTSISFYTDKKLYQRQEKNMEAYMGNQGLYKASRKSKPYKENVIYEGISRQKPIALSRLPDLTVKPGNDSPQSKDICRAPAGALQISS